MSKMEFENIDDGVRAWRETPGAVLLDVRTPEEYASGHIPGSVNFPLERMRDYNGDVDARILAYCRSGSRSARACALLEAMDYSATSIGGIVDYTGALER